MQRDPRAYLFDVVSAAQAIETFIESSDFDAFVENDMLRSAVERKFEIIGEALSQLSKRDADLVKRITSWRDIIGFRNVLAHGYSEVDYSVVWRTYVQYLPRLRSEVEGILGEVGDN